MTINTKVFGEVTVEDDKIIHFAGGIVGFPELQDFTLIHNSEKQEATVSWMVSIQEPAFAMPVIDPLMIVPDYNPEVEEELLKPTGDLKPEEMLVLVTMTVPKDITQMSINLKAPIVINATERKGCQVITEGDQYAVKYPVYDILQAAKERAGE